MIGVLQTGSVLHIKQKHVTSDAKVVMHALRDVTGKRFDDDPRVWFRWFHKQKTR